MWIKKQYEKKTKCLSTVLAQYEYFYGSFVAQADEYGVPAKYDLSVTAPSGAKLYEVVGESEATFHLVPVEAGAHRFCLTFNVERSPNRAIVPRDVLWNLNIGYSEVCVLFCFFVGCDVSALNVDDGGRQTRTRNQQPHQPITQQTKPKKKTKKRATTRSRRPTRNICGTTSTRSTARCRN